MIVDSFVVVSEVEKLFISGLAPASAETGGDAFTLTVDGAGFVNGAVVRWNNFTRPTTFVSPTQLKASITRADIGASGSFEITVANPGSTGDTSNIRVLTVAPPFPKLLTEAGSDRALALDSVTQLRGPFSIMASHNFSLDKRTRITLFATDIDLMSADVQAVTAQAEDSQNRTYPLVVEFVGRVPAWDWLTQVNVKLPDALENAGEVRISISVRGTSSNKVRLTVGPSLGSFPRMSP